MTKTTHNLPSDITVLHQIICDLKAENSDLRAQLALLKAKRFGKSSEKLDAQIAELELRVEEEESNPSSLPIEADEEEAGDKGHGDDTKKRAKRKPLPPHLPRVDAVIKPEAKCPECGGEEFRKIADDVSETLDYVPSSFRVVRHIRPRCACKNCEHIVQGFVPEKTIAKGKAEPGLLAHIMIQKYCNHLPLYRQSQIYERENVELARSTMASWVGQCAKLLEPLINELKSSIFSSQEIHGDDTPIRVLSPGLGKTKTGRLWAYVRDGRAHGSDIPPAVCYFYSPDRKGIRPLEHLKDFKGTLHADAYAGFDQLYIKDNNGLSKIIEAACWAHTRRKFHELTVAIPNASIGEEALVRIGKLYQIEDQVRKQPPDIRLAHRQKHANGFVDEFFIWIKECLKKLPKKSETTKAINYAISLEASLRLYLTDGKIEIDNNIAERAMRGVAIGRKNWLFAGSDKGGESAAAFYSIIETAKLNGLNPHEYLAKVLAIIQNHNSQKIAELLPWNLKMDSSITQ